MELGGGFGGGLAALPRSGILGVYVSTTMSEDPVSGVFILTSLLFGICNTSSNHTFQKSAQMENGIAEKNSIQKCSDVLRV